MSSMGTFFVTHLYTNFIVFHIINHILLIIEVRDSRTGYLIPARDGPGALPDMDSSWDVAAAAVAVSCQNVTLISFSFRA